MKQTENPYSPPETTEAPLQMPIQELADDIHKKIKGGGIAAVVTGIMSLFHVILVFQVDQFIMTWDLVGVVFSFLMAIGIFAKNRTCAVLMFLFYVAKQIIIVMRDADPSAMWVVVILLAVCLFQAVQGTFRYHNWQKKAAL